MHSSPQMHTYIQNTHLIGYLLLLSFFDPFTMFPVGREIRTQKIHLELKQQKSFFDLCRSVRVRVSMTQNLTGYIVTYFYIVISINKISFLFFQLLSSSLCLFLFINVWVWCICLTQPDINQGHTTKEKMFILKAQCDL